MINFVEMIKIQAKKDVTTIEILGEIGESWFDEGITLKSVKKEIDDITTPKIEVTLGSLGGNLFDGLAIHDYLKASKKHVTVNIISATASSGTIVALGADTVNISENALFLVHNSMTGQYGNAEELRKAADNLDTADNRIVSIYKAKTNQSEEDIRSLMAEDKWIDAETAKEFGFVDNITQGAKIAASVITQINNSKELPKLIINKKTQLEMTEESKSWFETKFAEIKANFKPIAKEKTEDVISKSEFESQMKEVHEGIEALGKENDTQKATIEALNKELADEKAKKVEVKADGADPDKAEKLPTDKESSIASIKAYLKSRNLR